MLGIFKKGVAWALLCIILIGALASCGAQSGVPDGYQLIACEGDCFRLYVPTGWTSNSWSGVTGAFYSMAENASVSVYVADDAAEMTAEEYWEYSNEMLAGSLTEYSFSGKTEKAVLGGQPAVKASYSAKVSVKDDGETVETVYKFLQVMARYGGEMYILLYSAPEEYYDSHVEAVEGDSDGKGIIPYFVFAEPYRSEEKKEYADDVELPEGMKLISTDERAYRFFVPVDWVINDRTEISAAYAPENDSANVSLQMYMTGDESKTVSDFFAECEERYETVFDSYTLLSDTEIEMSGIKAKKYVYTVVIGGVEYRQMQAIVMQGAVYYVLTYTALPEVFDAHLNDVDLMIEHFYIGRK
ncbi:MAG: hypothetical protein IJY39_14240 [Clostridia bacterium]|nr:hypothetical protein [Clostridia bacterium]